MKFSTLNIAVSKYVERKVNWIAKKANTQLIYNCVNISENNNIQFEKENLIITVGLIDSERTFFLKGIDTFIEVARLLPEFKFMIVGLSKNLPENILKTLPENLESFDRVNHDELETFYKRAKIYCQFSRTESFGVAIVEAMNFGCIPIVTNVGGIPELVGENGKIVKRNPENISKLITRMVVDFKNSDSEKDFKNGNFSVEIRKEKILSLMG